jgi:hypothetical protein
MNKYAPIIPDDVQLAAMEKHARQKRDVIVNGEPDPKGPTWVGVPGRHEAVLVEELHERVLRHGNFEQKDKAVGQNDEPRRNQWVPGWNRVSYRNHASLPQPRRAL